MVKLDDQEHRTYIEQLTLDAILLRQEVPAKYIAKNEHLYELAKMIAAIAGTKICYEKPDLLEAKGFSKSTKALLDSSKITSLGWISKYILKQGLEKTVKILSSYLK